MEKETTSQHKPLLTAQLERCCPAVLLQALTAVAQARHSELYLVGGTVRDLLTGRLPKDLDCTVAVDAAGFCHDVRELLTTGTIVPLGTELEEAARLVWQGYEVDVSAFRRGATTIEQDLSLRDFSINAMAIRLDRRAGTVLDIIDPMGGASDLQNHLLNHCPEAFFHDPLRLLRAYRFMATLDLDLAPATRADVRRFAARIVSVSGERIYSELHEIVLCSGSSDILWQMHEDGLLAYILPELYVGRGVKQPDFHHLDVFEHNFQTLRELERLLDSPQEVYPDNWQTIAGYLNETRVPTSWVTGWFEVADMWQVAQVGASK